VRSRELLSNAFGLGRGEVAPARPIEFIRDSGGTAHDLVGTSYATLHLASRRFIDVLSRARFTGWTTFPVDIYPDDEVRLDGYVGFGVTGRCGPIDDNLSESLELPPPVPGGRASAGLRGLLFDPRSWDGSDVFTPEDRSSVFVTTGVKVALEAAAVTGLEFRSITSIERPVAARG
jgi:hypothetical protein